MNNRSNKFIQIFEDVFFNNLDENEKLVLACREKIKNVIANSFGLTGIIFLYIMMVLRNSQLNIPVYKDIAIFDLNSELILRKPAVSAGRHEINLKRRHLPKLKIIKELINTYLMYKKRLRRSKKFSVLKDINSNIQLASNNPSGENSHSFIDGVSPSKRYLYFMLHFYIHRSIMLNNSSVISNYIRCAITINEFTPEFLGYLSIIHDIKIPIILYLPTRLVESQMPNSSLDIFTKIIAKNGIDADFIKTRYCVPVNLERQDNVSVKFNPNKPPRVGIFLASFYTMEIDQLEEFITTKIMPFIREIYNKWNAELLTISCHPSDLRSINFLQSRNVKVANIDEIINKQRMLDYDLVICGNSSVVEEALHCCLPVVYTGNIDIYKFDLFRYVEDGLVIDATTTIPSLVEVSTFYKEAVNKNKTFTYGYINHEVIDFMDVINNC